MYTRDKMIIGLRNPIKTFKYLISSKAKKNIDGFDPEASHNVVIMTKEHNKKSKSYIRFEFYKKILFDSLPDESLRTQFFKNSEKISELEMETGVKLKVNSDRKKSGAWRDRTHTMIGDRLDNLQFCFEEIIKNNVPGDLMETGVWRGGACIFMRLMLKEYDIKDRLVYVADSFEGLPKPNSKKYPKDKNDMHHIIDVVKVSIDDVKNNFKAYGVLDNQVRFLKGWFKDTMKDPPFEKLSILRLDGDMYESTWDVLTNCYDKLSIGGYLIVDDYALSACHDAVDDFRSQNNIDEHIEYFDAGNVYWKKVKNISSFNKSLVK